MNEDVIPKGLYCYTAGSIRKTTSVLGKGLPKMSVTTCPYWSIRPDKPAQMNGYCSFLKQGDWEDDGFGLLWDQVKACGINDDFDEDVDEITPWQNALDDE